MMKVFILSVNGQGELENFYIDWLRERGIKITMAKKKNGNFTDLFDKICNTWRKRIIFQKNITKKDNLGKNVIYIDVSSTHPRDNLRAIVKWLGKNKRIRRFYVPAPIIELYQSGLSFEVQNQGLFN